LIRLNSNSIENKGDANWWRRHSKSFCEYGVRRKKENLKRHKLKNRPFLT
jgi:hypothetical protein